MTMLDYLEDVIMQILNIKSIIVLRDTKERGRTPDSILYQYNRFVKSAFDDFIKPV